MRKTTLIILMCISGIISAYSQSSVSDKYVNIKAKNKSVKFFLKQISNQTGYFFTYNPDIVPENKILTYSAKKVSIKDALDIILADSTLFYKVIEDHIVICKNKQTANIFIHPEINSENQIYFSGKITNKKTGKPISFSPIGILNTTKGTVSNKNGIFYFKFDRKFKDSTLFITHIGYKTQLIPISKIQTIDNDIQLIEDFISIHEVIIRTNNPVKILKQALKNKQKNYLQKPSILTAFYREGVDKREEILNFSEAIIKIYKTSYKPSFNSDKIRVEKSRKIVNTEQIDTLNVKLKDGLYSGLELDIIKNPLDFIEEINIPNYKYQISDIVTFGDKLAYVIDFKPKDTAESYYYKGQIYIETESLTIISIEFELSLKNKGKNVNFTAKKSRKFTVNPISANYKVTYKTVGNKYMLNHVRADLEFKIKQKRSVFSAKYRTFFETVVLDVDTTDVKKFERKQQAQKNMVFIDSNYKYDPDFWGTNNFITPEKAITDAIEEIKVKLSFKK